MKKRFLTLALAAIPLLGSCGKLNEVSFEKWSTVYNNAIEARKSCTQTLKRLKGTGNGEDFDTGYIGRSINSSELSGVCKIAALLLEASDTTLTDAAGEEDPAYTYFAKGKELGLLFDGVTVYYNKYGFARYINNPGFFLEFTISYK